jgi:uncharacterized SAM-dependent methyltransferase
MEQPDYYIKDEGEFLLIGFKTQKAKDAIKTAIENQTGFVGNNQEIMLNQLNEIFEMCIQTDYKNNFISWAISHNLRGEDF